MASRDTSWFDEIWPRAVVASGIGYLALAYGVSRWLTRRANRPVVAPAVPHCRFGELTCRTSDGILLRGWLLEPPRPRGTIVVFHGMRNDRSYVLDRIEFLTAAGYRCIAFDHRAHGESGGNVISFGYHERHDVAAVADLVRYRWPNEPCGALGISMGGAAICFAGDAARAFDVIVLESVYHDLDRAFSHRIGSAYPAWFRHFRPGVVWLTEHRLKTRLQHVAPVAHVAKLAPRPVLLLTGSADVLAPPEEVQAFLSQMPGTSQFHCIPNAAHGKMYEVGGAAYRDLLLGFFARHLSEDLLSAAA
ncbi:MAG TPA: alpha/beta fold hydrolase [Gemmataceae bacterium]|nr:alpha/beta fold hydrolase [Gemmataceae bacterium]